MHIFEPLLMVLSATVGTSRLRLLVSMSSRPEPSPGGTTPRWTACVSWTPLPAASGTRRGRLGWGFVRAPGTAA